MRLLGGVGAAAASGGIYGAAFPPADLAWLAWVSLVPLLVAAARARPLEAAALGLVWSAAMAASTSFWLPGMLTGYFDASPGEAWLGFFAIAAGLVGTYVAIFSAWLAFVCTRGAAAAPLVGCGWAACEFARAHLLVANPWALSAYSQIGSPIAQTADLGGPFGIAFLIGTTNAMIAGAVEPRLRPVRWRWHGVAVGVLLVGAWAYGTWRADAFPPEGEPLRVSIVQGAAVRPYQHDDSDSRAVLERHLELTEQVLDESPDLVVWPEGAADFQPGSQTQRSLRLLRFARKNGVEMIVGGIRATGTAESPALHNSMFHIRKGRLVSVYDKLELMPFAEENPLRDWIAIGTDRYDPGPHLKLLEVGEASVGTLICSEAMLPGHARRLSRAGATLLFNPSNDYWFGSESAARQQLTAARFRAIENRRSVIRATSTGYSALIAPSGRVAAESAFGTADLLTGVTHGSKMESFYTRFGDAAAWLCVASALLFPMLLKE